MERIHCVSPMGTGVGEWLNNIQKLHDRAGPSVGNDQRKIIRFLGAYMQEVNRLSIDLILAEA